MIKYYGVSVRVCCICVERFVLVQSLLCIYSTTNPSLYRKVQLDWLMLEYDFYFSLVSGHFFLHE